MEIEDNRPKCDTCGRALVHSRKFIASTNVYWNKPWGSALKMSVPVIPHACMKCGRVYFYLGDRKKIIREFNDQPEADRKRY
jgi:hypothetical protein